MKYQFAAPRSRKISACKDACLHECNAAGQVYDGVGMIHDLIMFWVRRDNRHGHISIYVLHAPFPNALRNIVFSKNQLLSSLPYKEHNYYSTTLDLDIVRTEQSHKVILLSR